MLREEESVVVQRPIDEVFAYFTDPAMIPEWQASALEARLEGEGPMRAGSRVVETRKFLGRRMESRMEVLDYEPPRRFTVKVSSGPVPFQARTELTEEDGGTRVQSIIEGEPGGFFKLAEPIVARALRRELQGNLETLKDVLESRS